jgi:hypothetical protein
MGETTRNLAAFLRLGFGSSTVPFRVLQAEDMFYEEMCLDAEQLSVLENALGEYII